MKLLVKFRRQLFTLSAFLLLCSASMLLAGCGAAAWITDANAIIGVVGLSFASILSFIGGLTGNAAVAAVAATFQTWVTEIQTGLSDIQTLIEQYQAAASPTLLTEIESTLSDVETNIKQDFSNLGLPASILSVISGIAGLALAQLTAWSALIPALKTGMAMAEFKAATAKLLSPKEYKDAVNKILSTPTGDPVADAALAKVKKL